VALERSTLPLQKLSICNDSVRSNTQPSLGLDIRKSLLHRDKVLASADEFCPQRGEFVVLPTKG